MKKGTLSFWIIFILVLSVLSAGCFSGRFVNHEIILTTDMQYNGSYTEKTGDVIDTYNVTVRIVNSDQVAVARKVRIDRFTYCNDLNETYMTCIEDKKFLENIGDMKPRETIIRQSSFERPAWQSVPGEKFCLTYSASSYYPF